MGLSQTSFKIPLINSDQFLPMTTERAKVLLDRDKDQNSNKDQGTLSLRGLLVMVYYFTFGLRTNYQERACRQIVYARVTRLSDNSCHLRIPKSEEADAC